MTGVLKHIIWQINTAEIIAVIRKINKAEHEIIETRLCKAEYLKINDIVMQHYAKFH